MDREKLFSDKRSLFWILQISGWLLLALVYLSIYYRDYLDDPKAILAILLTYVVGFFITLLLRKYFKDYQIQRQNLSRLALTFAISVFIAANGWFILDVALSTPIHGSKWLADILTLQRYLSSVYWHTVILGTWSALYFMIRFWMEWTMQKERTIEANTLAQTAQLQMLRYQLNPHFLFNALNSIRALVDENQANAKEMITELSEFLRYSLTSKNFSDVPLKQELEAIRHYFRVEKKRYEEKLQVEYQINPLAEEYPVLSFLVHPLVENAVKYGMQTSAMPLRITLKADVKDGDLILQVCNSGNWLEKEFSRDSQDTGTGTGLNNIRQRLENAFPGRHRFEVTQKTEQVCIRIEIHKPIIQ